MFRPPHPRSAHRANQGSGLAILSRPPQLPTPPAAQHRRPAIPAQRRRPAGTHQPTPHRRAAPSLTHRVETALQAASAGLTHRFELALRTAGGTIARPAVVRAAGPAPGEAMHFLLTGLGALIILSIVVVSVFFVIAQEQRGPVASAAPRREAIASRGLDSTPLTGPEVFPGDRISPADPGTAYRVTSTQVDGDCALGVTGDLGAALAENGCSQLVRARLTAPYGGYQVTAGLFNLTDEAAAARASERAGSLVEAGTGTFASLIPAGAEATTPPMAQVNWHTRGHYLLFCVISRPDGALVADDDPYASRIAADLIERHLAGRVVARRAAGS